MYKLLPLGSALALICSYAAAAQTISNDAIVTLSKAGLGDGLIIDKINSVPCGYDVSTDKIIALKHAGLSDNVLSAMVRRCATVAQQRGVTGDDTSNDPKVRHSPGIYLMDDWLSPAKMQIIRPSKSSGMRSSGNGSVIFPFITKMMLPGDTSKLKITAGNPNFYFYFNTIDSAVSDFGTENSVAAQSPDEFSLVRFSQKSGAREIKMGKASFYGGAPVSLKKGIDPKSTVPFKSDDIGNGAYRVSVDGGLANGEFAFVFTGANGTSRIYDFSIDAPLTAPVTKKGRSS